MILHLAHIFRSALKEVKDQLVDIRETLRDNALSLLNDALYRGNEDAKKLERQCAKISRAIDKAICECINLEKMTQDPD